MLRHILEDWRVYVSAQYCALPHTLEYKCSVVSHVHCQALASAVALHGKSLRIQSLLDVIPCGEILQILHRVQTFVGPKDIK